MEAVGDPMIWEYPSPQPYIPPQVIPVLDWEPEIPGQFETPLRIRRKRNAEAAGFAPDASDVFYNPSLFTTQGVRHIHFQMFSR